MTTKYSYTSEPTGLEERDGGYLVTSRLTGNFPGSPVDLRFAFRLERDKIAFLEIAPSVLISDSRAVGRWSPAEPGVSVPPSPWHFVMPEQTSSRRRVLCLASQFKVCGTSLPISRLPKEPPPLHMRR